MDHKINLTINGRKVARWVESQTTLLDFLREEMELTGVKEGCGVGECGACAVIMDGHAVRSCLVLAVEADGSCITTVEGLSDNGKLTPVQEAFVGKGAVQCGFCTPGFVVAGENLLRNKPDATKEEILEALGGHLCRCTGYVQILEAIEEAKNKIKKAL